MRVVFMGTPGFAVPSLDALVAAGHEVARVYTQPPRPAGRGKRDRPSPVHLRADELGAVLSDARQQGWCRATPSAGGGSRPGTATLPSVCPASRPQTAR